MNNLINVNTDKQTVSARELHKEVGSTERFANWFERQLQFGFEENMDYTCVKVLTEVQNNGGVQERELQDYEVSIDMAKQICMVQKNDRAKQIRQYLIDLEKAWNTPEQIMARALKVAGETINKLKTDCSALLEDNKRMKPKEIFADAVATSHTSILIGDLAKLICQNGVQIGQKRLFSWLRDNGYLIKRKGADWNMPTQRSMELGLFEIKESSHVDGNGCNILTRTPKATGKAQVYFVNKFLTEVAV